MGQVVKGAQVVSRVALVMRTVASLAPEGGTTTSIADLVALSRPTTHRILASLLNEGYVERDQETGRWFLGPEIFVMGALAGRRYDVMGRARRALRDIAAETQESAFFSVRRQDETVCLMREEGSFPIRSFVLHEGVRFPLGVASAGLAIVSHLGESEAERYLAEADLEQRWGEAHADAALRARIAETRRAGYAVNPGLIVEGSWGVGAAVFDVNEQPEWALSVTGVESRFTEARQRHIGRLLLDHAHRLSRSVKGSAPVQSP